MLGKLKSFAQHINLRDQLAKFESRSDGATSAPAAPVGVTVTVNVPARTARFEKVRVGLTEQDRALLERLPVKVAKKAKLLMEQNLDKVARKELAAGRNPFLLKGNGYLHVACEMLLNGGFTRASLREEYIKRLGWTQGTAFSHVSVVVSLFSALGLAVETDHGFQMPQELKTKIE